MAVLFSNAGALSGQAGGVNRSRNVTIPTNTKAFYVFVYPDASNTTGSTSNPSVITLNDVTMTFVAAVPAVASAPYGQCQHVYKIDNPPIGTFSLSVTHVSFFFASYVSITAPNPLITTVGNFSYTTSTSPNCTVSSSIGNNTLFSVVADATDPVTGITDDSGTLTKLVGDGGTGRCGYNLSSRLSSGASNSASWTIASEQWSAIAINFSDDIYIVDSVTDPVQPSGTITYTTSGFASVSAITTNISGVTVGSLIDSSGDGTAVVSGFVEGSLYPILPTAITYTFTEGSNSSAKNGNISVPSGYTKLVVDSPLVLYPNTIAGSIYSSTGREIATNDVFYHTSYGDLIITADTDFTVTTAGSFDLWLRVAAGADAGKMYQYTINISESGAITATSYPNLNRLGIGLGIGI